MLTACPEKEYIVFEDHSTETIRVLITNLAFLIGNARERVSCGQTALCWGGFDAVCLPIGVISRRIRLLRLSTMLSEPNTLLFSPARLYITNFPEPGDRSPNKQSRVPFSPFVSIFRVYSHHLGSFGCVMLRSK